MAKLRLFLAIFVVVAVATASPTNRNLKDTLYTPGSSANIIITMSAGTQQVLKSLGQAKFINRAAKLNGVTSALKSHAAESQKHILDFLTQSVQNNQEFHSLWISNQIFVSNADAALVEKLEKIEGIAEIYEEHVAQLVESPHAEESSDISPLAEPGIELIQAHFVWSEYGINGTGTTVATIASGARSTHEALRDNFLNEYGWFDPAVGSLFPNDTNGQGTHTLGIMVGSHGVGVAPGAKWMTCRACPESSCTEFHLNRCAEFVLCPTLADGTSPDCTIAPHVVSNMWTGGQGDMWFNPSIQAWKTAGIVPVFATGQNGPNCGTARSPGDSTIGVIAVGATTESDGLYSVSSQGPSVTGLIKPDLVAPGYYIRSASRTSDTSYTSYYGVSQATAHVAGVIAFLTSVNPDLPYSDVEKYLINYTDRAIQRTEKNCDGVPETIFPNNAFGWGRLNAFKAVRALLNSMKTN